MKTNETDFLNKLFTKPSAESEELEIDFPLLDVPNNLSENLHAITESTPVSLSSVKQRKFNAWPKVASIAASALLAVVAFQFYQQQQTLNQLEQAQYDLATAIHYLDEANKITRAHMFNTLNTNMKKAAVAPVIVIGRDTVLPTLKSLESDTKTSKRTL